MLLCAGDLGNRSALPSASIMIRQPMQRIIRMQSSDIDIYRQQIRGINTEIVKLLSKHTGHTRYKIAKDIFRPKYFTSEGKYCLIRFNNNNLRCSKLLNYNSK